MHPKYTEAFAQAPRTRAGETHVGALDAGLKRIRAHETTPTRPTCNRTDFGGGPRSAGPYDPGPSRASRQRRFPFDPETPAARSQPSEAEPVDPSVLCRWCLSRRIVERQASPPHYRKWVCLDCRRCIGFKKTPRHVREARRFVLTAGEFRGARLGELLTTLRGREYLRWLAEDVLTATGRMAEILLRQGRASGAKGGS
jgi:hypothetical protein